MESTVKRLMWAWIILASSLHFESPGVCSISLPDITNRTFIDECVQEHNKARSSVSPGASNMLYMTWDEGLAITARAWARNCLFEHNIHLGEVHRMHPVFPSVGENIWAAYPPSTFTVTSAINSWVNEKQYYSYNAKSCTNVCGHYTQVVWAKSYKVGCAVQVCPNGVKETRFSNKEGVIFVCNYATAGNVVGQRPYATGSPCTQCEGECRNLLCREYSAPFWTPDWDPALQTCGPACLAVLALRPLALIATFIAAYGVHHFYPDIFCYE
uniref:GLI pathosis related 1 n=1 Tax=Myripristis murdjan TaxID=586833 RepID=A0A668AMG5_9TELE